MFQLLQIFVLFQIFCFGYGKIPVNCTRFPKATMCLTDVSTDPLVPDEEDIANIVYLHNEYRQQVNPRADAMYKMYWNEDLAELALKWAMQCRFDHDPSGGRIIRGYAGIGQNVLAGNSLPTWNQTVSRWHAEIHDYVYGVKTNKMVGHYTQAVFWGAKGIGCGAAYCPNSPYKYIFVCDYISGQYNTQFPYKLADSTHVLTKCNRVENETLCDCGTKTCQYGGSLNIATCTCSCFNIAEGDQCETKKCKPDASFCPYYPKDFCKVVYNYGFSRYCPETCGEC